MAVPYSKQEEEKEEKRGVFLLCNKICIGRTIIKYMCVPLKKKYSDHNKLNLNSLKLFADRDLRRSQALVILGTKEKFDLANRQRRISA